MKHLFENILLSHEFLSLTVWFDHHHVQHRLSSVCLIHHKKHQVLQQLNCKPTPRTRTLRGVVLMLRVKLVLMHVIKFFSTAQRSNTGNVAMLRSKQQVFNY